MPASPPVLSGLNLVVRDMDATLAFYRTLGLDIPEDSVWSTDSGAHHVAVSMENGFDLDFDSAQLAQIYNSGYEGNASGSRSVIGFSVATRDEVDTRFAELTKAGHSGLQPPYDAFWGARYAIVEDPDGNHVGLMSPIDPERRSDGPSL